MPRDTRTKVGSVRIARANGGPESGAHDIALSVGDRPLGGSDPDVQHEEAESRVAASVDTKETRQARGFTEPGASGLSHERPRKIATDESTREYHPTLAYPDRQRNTPTTVAVQPEHPHRRVAARERAKLRQHLDVQEPTQDASDRSTDRTASAEGISAFLGRVLNQLSLSAWLPAVMLVGSLSVLLQLHAQPNRDLAEASTKLVDKPLGLLVVLLFSVILATMVTQAFEFEVIRLLEGYWGNSRLIRGLLRLSIDHQDRKLRRLLQNRDELTLQAFREAKLVENGIIPAHKRYIADLIEGELAGQEMESRGWRARRRANEAQKYKQTWQQFAPANLMSRLEAVEAQIDEYPEQYRILPTKLGNVIRAVEDSIKLADGEDLESFVIRRWDSIPISLRKEHDQYRTRLDLYCTLMFVFIVLAILSPPLITLGSRYLMGTVITSLSYLILAFVSYIAAIASARGYRAALKAINDSNLSIGKTKH
jgi:hypothetical protein